MSTFWINMLIRGNFQLAETYEAKKQDQTHTY
jgi:hypothetical protein